MATFVDQPTIGLKRFFWMFFIIVGLFHLLPTFSGFCIPCVEPHHWDWLTQDPEIVDYLSFTWQILSLFEASLSVFMMVTAVTGYRKGERWAWYLLWLWLPVLVGETILMPWSWPLLVTLMVLLVIGQLWTRSYFWK